MENEYLDGITLDLIDNIKAFRSKAENIIMNKERRISYRDKMKTISDKMFDLQIELNNL